MAAGGVMGGHITKVTPSGIGLLVYLGAGFSSGIFPLGHSSRNIIRFQELQYLDL